MLIGEKILVAGAGGFIGGYLVSALRGCGAEVLELSRNSKAGGKIFWDPSREFLDQEKIEGVNAVVNLAGENIFGRWSGSKKKAILDSRINSVKTLSKAVKGMGNPPKVFISASAVGYYGTNPEGVCDEHSPKGTGFLSDVCGAWEAECAEVAKTGVRVVNPRFGIVLDKSGGLLERLEKLSRFGLTVNFDAGKEKFFPWISLEDLSGAIKFCIANESISGPVNFVEVGEVSIAKINRALGIRRRIFLNLNFPKWIAELAFGEMAKSLMLSSARVSPRKLLESNFKFCKSDISKIV